MASKWWTLTAVALATLMFLVDITIVNVALPDIQRSLGASLAELQWIVDAYPLALAALLLTAGSLGDRLGRRRVHAVGIAVFTVGSLLCGLAGDPLVLALARARAGRRRRRDVRHRDRAAGERVPRPRPRHGVRRLRCGHRAGRGVGAGARRGDHLRPVVALDLLREHPARPRRARHHAAPGRRVARPGRAAARLAGRGELLDRPRAARPGPHPGQRGGLGASGGARLRAGGGRAARPVRADRAPAPHADVRPRSPAHARPSSAGCSPSSASRSRSRR